ncbi:XRE family transcriptional regulator [Phenylobacterium sp.]|jgi:transcriptional regulator with XRE-family HTH domain|uniref:helix-turn-helix domain-containing protein n=1 Tax=Phenylobacterium sp. TaxID=1871053 RepID=UPI002F3F1643
MVDEKSLLSARVKSLRERRGWSIAELARRTGVSVSMLWKVENAQTTLTYGKLGMLAAGLEVPVGELFANPGPSMRKGGRRVINHSGSGPSVDVNSNLHHFLATEIASKHYSPCIVDVRADGDGSDAETHGGEEFTYVLSGRIRFVCEGYATTVLEAGDSVYFDAALAHRYLTLDGEPAQILTVYSHPENAKLEDVVAPESRPVAMRAFEDLRAANESPAAPKPRRQPKKTR